MSKAQSVLIDAITKFEAQILEEWSSQQKALGVRNLTGKENELRAQSGDFWGLFGGGIKSGSDRIQDTAWDAVRDFLENLSRTRAKQGFTPTETALFVFSLKEPIFKFLREEAGTNAAVLAEDLQRISSIIDKLGLFTIESYQRSREDVIARQQQELLELSTPVVKLWDEILALPLIGTLDSARTQVVMESLLQEIVSTGASIAIIDITGVPTVDTLVAQHLLKTVAAARLMGADCIISGIRPQIAQTIVHLGVELNDVITKATLADAFALALTRTGKAVVAVKRQRPSSELDQSSLSQFKS